MADPKTFTGDEYAFTLYESDVRPGVIVRHKQAPLDHGQWISLTDLLAFVAWRGAASELSVVELEATAPTGRQVVHGLGSEIRGLTEPHWFKLSTGRVLRAGGRMNTLDAAREALAVLLEFTDEWTTDRDMGATFYYCRSCMAHADRMTADGRIVGRHVAGCKLLAAINLAQSLAPKP